MEAIPKRDDTIYKEIESFKDYELTQCVAYEMAVRNNINKLLIETIHLQNKAFCSINQYRIKTLEEQKLLQKKYRKNVEKLNNLAINESEYLTILQLNGFDSKYFKFFGDFIDAFSGGESTIFINPYTVNLYDILDITEIEKLYDCIKESYDFIKNRDLNFFKNVVAKNFKLSMAKYSNCISLLETAYLDATQKIRVENSFARPELTLPKIPYASISINLALPEKELISYIKEIKNKFIIQETYEDENGEISVISKTPLEVLYGEFQEAQPTKNYPKKPKAEQMADMFFVYDYVTARYKELQDYKNQSKKEYDETINSIQNNKDLSTKDKKIQKTQTRLEYEQNKSDADLKSLCAEEEIYKQVNLKKDRTYQYYRAIKPYIEECRYKELITGVSSL